MNTGFIDAGNEGDRMGALVCVFFFFFFFPIYHITYLYYFCSIHQQTLEMAMSHYMTLQKLWHYAQRDLCYRSLWANLNT